jgi:hypothetical protein
MNINLLIQKGIKLLRIFSFILSIGINLFILFLIWEDYNSPNYVLHPEHYSITEGIELIIKWLIRVIAIIMILIFSIDFLIFKLKISIVNVLFGTIALVLTLFI